MRFSVCPHDMVKQMQVWLDLTAYLQQTLQEPVTLEPITDFATFYARSLPQAHLWRLVQERGFVPLFRTESYDEVVFITQTEKSVASLQDFQHQVVAAVPRQFATHLGFYLLHERGIAVAGALFVDSWVQVIRALMQGRAPFGLLYADFYADLTQLARSQFRVIYTSQTKYATHMLLLHPDYASRRERVQSAFAAMATTDEGAALLQRLRIGAWVPTADLGPLEHIMQLPIPEVGGM